MGEVHVPAERYWGAQTQRSLEHFPIGAERFRWGRPVIRALGVLKLAAARANEELGRLTQAQGRAHRARLHRRSWTAPSTRSSRSSSFRPAAERRAT